MSALRKSGHPGCVTVGPRVVLTDARNTKSQFELRCRPLRLGPYLHRLVFHDGALQIGPRCISGRWVRALRACIPLHPYCRAAYRPPPKGSERRREAPSTANWRRRLQATLKSTPLMVCGWSSGRYHSPLWACPPVPSQSQHRKSHHQPWARPSPCPRSCLGAAGIVLHRDISETDYPDHADLVQHPAIHGYGEMAQLIRLAWSRAYGFLMGLARTRHKFQCSNLSLCAHDGRSCRTDCRPAAPGEVGRQYKASRELDIAQWDGSTTHDTPALQ